MRIDIITVLPEMIEGFFNYSIMSRAQKKGIADVHIHNLRDYAYDRYRKVDDYPFGGCAGMVMKIEPIDRCISALKAERDYDEVIFTSPDGEQFNQKMANTLSLSQNLIILCGHFKGIDYRIREHLITKEISIGDYVLTGGELAAAVISDAIVRIIPGVISTSNQHCLIRFKIIYLLHRYTPVRQSTTDGRCPMYCCQVTKRKSEIGSFSKRWNARNACAPICWKRNNVTNCRQVYK